MDPLLVSPTALMVHAQGFTQMLLLEAITTPASLSTQKLEHFYGQMFQCVLVEQLL
jgi:hypothetical protein